MSLLPLEQAAQDAQLWAWLDTDGPVYPDGTFFPDGIPTDIDPANAVPETWVEKYIDPWAVPLGQAEASVASGVKSVASHWRFILGSVDILVVAGLAVAAWFLWKEVVPG